MKLLSKLFILFAFVSWPFFVLAAEDMAAENDIESGGIASLKKTLAMKLPGIDVTQIKEAPIKGIYEVVVGSQVVYTDEDARYVIEGDLIDLKTKRNFTEESRAVIRMAKIDELGEENMLVYTPEKVKHTVTIVTDINCPYCRRLHAEMDEYMKNGIKVRYIFMPLKGKADYETTVSVWCSDDKNIALDLAKSGSTIEKVTCDNPIKRHLNVSRQIGVRGTPAIILENGRMLPGYVPVKKLVLQLNTLSASSR
jgi:thiol:disulfide interchange protein DsbC